MKEKFLNTLKTVKREGMEELINFLEKSDFFIAPAEGAGGKLDHC